MPPDQITFDLPAEPGRSSAAAHLTGRLLPDEKFGRYRVVRPLGAGAFGRVYLCLDPALDMDVAIKVPRSAALTSQFLARFQQEGRAAAKIRHENVCRVLAADMTKDGRPYFVFEYVPGPNLEEYVATRTRLRPADAARIMAKVARGVAAAHRAGVVHRDLKPANVLIHPDGDMPVVTDFGVARVAGHDGGSLPGQMIGTPAYMPPEQIEGDQSRVGPRSDVYAMGVMLFELVTGDLPYKQMVQALTTPTPPAASGALAEVPVEVCQAARRAMQKDPANRYQSADEFAAELERWLSTFIDKPPLPPPVEPDPPSDELPSDDRRFAPSVADPPPRRRWPWAVAGCGLVGLTAAGWSAWPSTPSVTPPQSVTPTPTTSPAVSPTPTPIREAEPVWVSARAGRLEWRSRRIVLLPNRDGLADPAEAADERVEVGVGRQLTDAGFAALGRRPGLAWLTLHRAVVTPQRARALAAAGGLLRLELFDCELAPGAVAELAPLGRAKLDHLALTGSQPAAGELARLRAALPGCEVVP